AREVQEVRADAVAVVDHHGAAGEVQGGIGEGHDAGRGRLDRRARGRGDVHAGVAGAGLSVVDPATAEAAADAAFHRADEALREIGAGIVAGPGGADARLLAADAFGDRRRRIDRFRRHAVDAFHRPVARIDLDAGRRTAAVGARDLHLERAAGIAAHAEDHGAVRGR